MLASVSNIRHSDDIAGLLAHPTPTPPPIPGSRFLTVDEEIGPTVSFTSHKPYKVVRPTFLPERRYVPLSFEPLVAH